MAYNDFWSRLGRGLQTGAGMFMDTYRTLASLQEAERRREEDRRQFDAAQRQRERELNVSQSQWRYEQEQQERENAYRKQQIGESQLWDSGLRAPPGVLADIVQPPAMSQFYGSQFLSQPEFQGFGESLAPEPMGFGQGTDYGIAPDTLSTLHTADAQRRDRQAQEQLLQHDEMQRELGRRQMEIRQRQASPNYLPGAPMALDAPVLEGAGTGGPTYGEFRGVSQEDLTHPSLRDNGMTAMQQATLDRQSRLDLLRSLSEQRQTMNLRLRSREEIMNQLKADPQAYDRQLNDWRSPQAASQYDAQQRLYQREQQDAIRLEQQVQSIQRQLFPDINWGEPSPTETGTGTGTGTTTPPPGAGEQGRTGSMDLPDPAFGEDGAAYVARLKRLGYDHRNPQHYANIQRKLAQFGLLLGNPVPQSDRELDPYNQY